MSAYHGLGAYLKDEAKNGGAIQPSVLLPYFYESPDAADPRPPQQQPQGSSGALIIVAVLAIVVLMASKSGK